MIVDNNHIIADEGKVLYCTWNNSVYGTEVYIGLEFYDKDGNRLETPYRLQVSDFTDVDEDSVITIDDKQYVFINMSYAAIKTFVVKLHYSNDDQIALMLNYQENPEKYTQAYQEMRNWRNYASEIAKKYAD